MTVDHTTAAVVEVLAEPEWRVRRSDHERRVDAWTAPRLERRRRGERHPVDDFLFEYYPYSPGRLRRWHPGHGVALAGAADEWLQSPGYVRTPRGVTTDPVALARLLPAADQVATLLRATAGREARFGCFALHEWAMVYGLSADEVRHAAWPLRLSPAEISEVVEAQRLRCTHFDAFRFYTPAARPLNERQLTRADQVGTEQPGCLHATMDLYKWAMKLSPFVSSDLVADCFALARDVRDLDMRAAPYDLRGLGVEPVRVETPEGRVAFVAEQRRLAERGARLRGALLARIESWQQDAGYDVRRDQRADGA
ncbi:MAG: 3-methyladenine DNA glycosylase [Candidatus Nanopelagicales bacterium]